MLTVLDQIANQNHLQLIKAIIPYLPSGSQQMIAVGIKMMEIRNILGFYKNNDCCVSACAAPSGGTDLIDILSDLRNYCDEKEQAMIDQCIQLMTTMELYSVFAQTAGEDMPEHTPGD